MHVCISSELPFADSDEEVILQPNDRLFYRQTEFFYLYDDCNKIYMYCHKISLSLLMHTR